ncbi:MAG: TolC family protein, partial [Vicinamibacteria bacterium]|nr:TolC family protein [Vicinamibacteria bacterium]
MSFRLCPGARVMLACALVAGASSSVFGQTAPAPAQPPVQVTPATTPSAKGLEPKGPVRQLSMDEAVKLALEQNLGIQIERFNPELQDLNTAQILSNYTPQFGGGVFTQSQDQPPSSFLSGGDTTITSDNFGFNTSISKLFKYGTDATVSFDSGRNKTNNSFSSFNPTLTGNLDLVVTQPLLRNFKFDTIRQQLFSSRINRAIADVDLRQTVALTARTVRNSYWDYVYAINALKVARQTLDLAQESLRNTRSRVEIGTLAPIDVVQAESEVASREEAVILAEASIGQAEDQLRSLIFDPKTPGFFDMRLEPTDTPELLVQEVDVTAAVDRALKERTDLISTRKRIEITDNNVKFFKNQTLPGLDARFDYNSTGLGGTQLVRDPDSPLFPPPVIGEVKRSFGDVLGNIFSTDFPTWRLSLNVTYPIGNSNADAGLARTRIEKTQSETSLRQLELNVATQVRDSGRQLVANSKRVEATRAAQVLAERRLEAEEKKFAAGMSTSFEVFQAQRDLAQARSTALRAVLDYAQSQVDFETVQIAPIGGGANFTAGTAVGGAVGAATAGAISG